MRLLLDTHTFLWFAEGSPLLSQTARTLIEDVSNERFLSAASLWEIAIKVGMGKLPLSQPLHIFIPAQMQSNSFDLLPILPEHTFQVSLLPYHHKDPFDRLIAAQSLTENIPLVSADTVFDAYGVVRFW